MQLLSPEILQVANEFLGFDPSLFENSPQSAYRQLRMQWNYAASSSFLGRSLEHDVASTLTSLSESQPFQCADSLGP